MRRRRADDQEACDEVVIDVRSLPRVSLFRPHFSNPNHPLTMDLLSYLEISEVLSLCRSAAPCPQSSVPFSLRALPVNGIWRALQNNAGRLDLRSVEAQDLIRGAVLSSQHKKELQSEMVSFRNAANARNDNFLRWGLPLFHVYFIFIYLLIAASTEKIEQACEPLLGRFSAEVTYLALCPIVGFFLVWPAVMRAISFFNFSEMEQIEGFMSNDEFGIAIRKLRKLTAGRPDDQSAFRKFVMYRLEHMPGCAALAHELILTKIERWTQAWVDYYLNLVAALQTVREAESAVSRAPQACKPR